MLFIPPFVKGGRGDFCRTPRDPLHGRCGQLPVESESVSREHDRFGAIRKRLACLWKSPSIPLYERGRLTEWSAAYGGIWRNCWSRLAWSGLPIESSG